MSSFPSTWGIEEKNYLSHSFVADVISWDEMERQRLSVIPYTGGKLGLVPNIVPLIEWTAMQYNLQGYMEATGGGGRMLLNNNLSLFKYRIYNDMDYSLCCLFGVLGDRFLTDDLIKMLFRQDYCESVFNKAVEARKRDNELANESRFDELSDIVTAAANTYVASHQSFRANMKSYGRSVERNKRDKYFDKVRSLDKFLPILSGVEVIRWDCRELIKDYENRSDYFIYVDPPYDPEAMEGDKHYEYSWTREDHERFVEQIKDSRNYMAISGYESDIYDQLDSKYGWKKLFLKDKHVSSSGTSRKEGEWLYINFKIPSELESVIKLSVKRGI